LENICPQTFFLLLVFPEFSLVFFNAEKKKRFRLLFPLQCMCVCIAGKDNYRSSGEGGKRSFARAMKDLGDAPWVPFRLLSI
jgi:hypothetical protein